LHLAFTAVIKPQNYVRVQRTTRNKRTF